MREDFKSIRRLRYPLPEVINPPESVCIEVRVPNDIAYISAFWGQMFALTRWYAWLGDNAHTAKDVAAVWRGVYEQAQESECQNVLVRTSPVNDCLLQVSYDGGALWETVYNAYGCALKAAHDEFGSGSNQPAGHSQPGEQPGGADPNPAQCFDLDLTVQANSMLLIPLAIKSGWTLKFTNVKGAWYDGAFLSIWRCPTGSEFFLGACGDSSTYYYDASDPIPAAPHLSLIIRLPDGSCAAIPAGGEYVIPSGMPDGNTFILANDSELSDNQGSVSLHLLACNGGWCYEFNVLTGLDTLWAAGLESGVGSVGTHWSSVDGAWIGDCYNYGADWYGAAQVHMTLPSGTYTRCEVDYLGQVGQFSYGNNNTYVYHSGIYIQAGPMENPPSTKVAGGLSLGAGNFAVSIGYANSAGNNNNCGTGNAKIRAIRLYGTGANPFGGNNC